YRKAVSEKYELRLHVPGDASNAITKKYRVLRIISHDYAPLGQNIVGWSLVGDVQELYLAVGQEHSTQTLTLEPGSSDLGYAPDRSVSLSPWEVRDTTYTLNATDGAGPRYRKVGLNGVPMPDDKPQVQDESGENPEETYVDAYSRQLRHSVSDVYASTESSMIPLTVRRDVSPESYSDRSGLRPSERPDRAFGMGWSSNLTPHIRFEEGQTRAVVTDEQGSTSAFVRVPPYWIDDPVLGPQYVHTPCIHTRQEKQHGKTRFDTLEEEVVGSARIFKLKKKFGTTCVFSDVVFAQSIPKDRLTGSDTQNIYQYARLTEVQDRLGNRLVYTYPVDGNSNALNTLIPNVISDPERPAVRMYIEQDDGRITKVNGPSGESITYAYGVEGAGVLAAPVLAGVTRGGNTVEYGYEVASETDPTPDLEAPGPVPVMQHLEVNRITDERDQNYTFEYAFNHTQTFVQNSGGQDWTRTQTGLPRLLTKVTLPNGAITNYGGTRTVGINLSGALLANNSVQTTVNGPAGSYTYLFTSPDIFQPLPDPGEEEDPSRSLTLTFKNFSLTSAAGTETYVLNPEAGMALASATDVSGNTTEFFYADEWEGTDGQSGFFDDPTSQRNALLGVKTFTYEAGTRVLKSVTDERGTRTEYTIQPLTGLRTQERVIDAGNNTLRVTDFEYG
ncbi:MAG: sugar-binding protein, partial [Roseimicrobium sp.]